MYCFRKQNPIFASFISFPCAGTVLIFCYISFFHFEKTEDRQSNMHSFCISNKYDTDRRCIKQASLLATRHLFPVENSERCIFRWFVCNDRIMRLRLVAIAAFSPKRFMVSLYTSVGPCVLAYTFGCVISLRANVRSHKTATTLLDSDQGVTLASATFYPSLLVSPMTAT